MQFKELLQNLDGTLLRTIQAGDIVMYQGEVPMHAYVVKSGILKAINVNKEGSERILNFAVEGEFFPFAWIFGKSSICLTDYQALTDCELYEISLDALQDIISKTKCQNEVFEWMVGNHTAAQLRIMALEQARAREKLLYTMYYLLKRFGRKVKNEWYVIEPKLTHQMIADLTGLTRETAAIELNIIKSEGAISYKSQKYFVNKSSIEKLLGEESLAGLSQKL